jgi:hypothetical protein
MTHKMSGRISFACESETPGARSVPASPRDSAIMKCGYALAGNFACRIFPLQDVGKSAIAGRFRPISERNR